MKMDNHYNFGLINGDNIILFNNSEHHANPITSTFLKDVNVEIDEYGSLNIEANSICFDFYGSDYGYRIFEKNWKHTPHPKQIHEGRRWWKRLFNIGKPERFVYHGWVRTTETEPFRYITNKYNIIIDE